jgi:hypothetical protein
MAAIDTHRSAVGESNRDGNPYSVRRSIVIIAGLSLSFWSVLGIILYEVL